MTDVLWGIVLIVVAIVAIAIVRKLLFEWSVNSRWKARTSGLSDPNASMGEIVEAVVLEPQGLTPEVHARFWSLAEDFTSDANSTVAIIAQAHLPYHQLLCHLFEDAIESLNSGTTVKSKKSLEFRKRLVSDNETGEAFLAKIDKFLEDVASRKPTMLFGSDDDPLRVHGERELEEQLEMSQATVAALSKLFEKPRPV